MASTLPVSSLRIPYVADSQAAVSPELLGLPLRFRVSGQAVGLIDPGLVVYVFVVRRSVPRYSSVSEKPYGRS